MTVEYRVTFDSGTSEFVTVTASTLTACIRAALSAARRYSPITGKRDHVVTIEFWERRA
jgi:hypothetical protein